MKKSSVLTGSHCPTSYQKRIRMRDALLVLLVAAVGWLIPLASRIGVAISSGDSVQDEDIMRYLCGRDEWVSLIGLGSAAAFAGLAIMIGMLSLHARKITLVGHVLGVLGVALVIPYLCFSGYRDILRAIESCEPGSSTAVIGFVSGPVMLFLWGLGIYGAVWGACWLWSRLTR